MAYEVVMPQLGLTMLDGAAAVAFPVRIQHLIERPYALMLTRHSPALARA